MAVLTENSIKTFGDCAYKGIKKHFKKVMKYESAVKKDENPEALHQMRIGMRRLRTAVVRFNLAVDLPGSVSDKNLGKIARRLGNLRDLDVLKETLETVYLPNLPIVEQERLQKAFGALAKQRKESVTDVQTMLKEERYKSFKSTLKDWLESPEYKDFAVIPIKTVLPDLLLPEVSSFLLHSGWLIGTGIEESGITSQELSVEKIEQLLETDGETLHSLRKQAKQIRYQMELFTNFYGESYAAFIADVKRIQEILGVIQDSQVLAEWLMNVLDSEIEAKFPTLKGLFSQKSYELWQQWQLLQKRYLREETRHGLHLSVLHPADEFDSDLADE